MSQVFRTDDEENSTPNRFKVTIGRSNVWWIILCVIFWCGNIVLPAVFWNTPSYQVRTNWAISPSDFLSFVAVGILVSEIELLSLWGAMGPQPAKFRITISGAVALVSGCAYVIGLRLPIDHASGAIPIDVAMVLLGMAFGGYLLFLIPFLALRYFLWITDFMEPISNIAPVKKDSQFGVRYLLIATLIVAILFTLVKQILPKSSPQSPRFDSKLFEMVFPFLGLAIYSALATLLATLVILCQRRSRTHGFAVFAIAVLFAVGPFFIMAILTKYVAVPWTAQWFQELERTYAFSFGLFISVVVVTTVARFQGYRLRTRNDFL